MGIRGAGFGIGFRPVHYQEVVSGTPERLDWLEIVSENFLGVGGRPRRFLERLRERYPVAMHGVGLSIGGADPLEERYLVALRDLVRWLEPMAVTDHLCWTSRHGRYTHDLLPFPLNEESLAHVASRVAKVQDFLGRRILLENPSTYVAFANSDIPEAEFLNALAAKTGCGVLLDVNNVFVNSQNLGIDAKAYVETLDPRIVDQFHLAGHSVYPDIRIDTHDHPVPTEVWELYALARARFPEAATLLEWDDKIPALDILLSELDKARAVAAGALVDPSSSTGADLSRHAARQAASIDLGSVQELFLAHIMNSSGEPDPSFVESLRTDIPAPRARGLEVYNRGYFLRLLDTLKETYPTLYDVLGERGFKHLAADYGEACPSRHFSLDRIGAGLPSFLLEWDGPVGVPTQILADLAALEWAKVEVYLAPDAETLSGEAFAALGPDDWVDLKLDFIDAARQLSLTSDVLTPVSVLAAGGDPEPPEERPVEVLVHRSDGAVYVQEISPFEAKAFRHFAVGRSFGDLVSTEDEARRVVELLARWCGLGLLRSRRGDSPSLRA